jgi:hypothetical protein
MKWKELDKEKAQHPNLSMCEFQNLKQACEK